MVYVFVVVYFTAVTREYKSDCLGGVVMKFTFRKSRKTIGWLAFQSMDKNGVCLPLHKGVNFIGKGLEDFCEYNERDQLDGIVEQSQVLLQINQDGCSVADFTSTNQTTLIRGSSATIVHQRLRQHYELLKKAIYFNDGSLPFGINSDEIQTCCPSQPPNTSCVHNYVRHMIV